MMTMKRSAMAVAVLLGAAASNLPAEEADYSHYTSPWKTVWEYRGPRGPEHWSALDPAYAACNEGKEQSPIDISQTQKAQLPALQFEYTTEPARYVINNRYTIRVNYHDAPDTGSFLIVGGKRYQLIQFHFHRPSEESVHGKRYAMVLHLMHRASDGEVAAVAVFLKAGHANATVQRLWQHMPEHEGQVAVPNLQVNPTDMLPHETDYYEYMGSVSAPPCTEHVMWFVLKTPVEISEAQIKTFAKLFPDDTRPLQPLNGRVVQETE